MITQKWRSAVGKVKPCPQLVLHTKYIYTKRKILNFYDFWDALVILVHTLVSLLLYSYDDGSVRPPDGQLTKNLFEDLKTWEETLNQEAEHFTGETLLSREEELYQMNKEVDGWTDVALKVKSNKFIK